MFKVMPYRSAVRNRDVFDLFEDFFGETRTYRSFNVDVRDLEKEYIIDAELPGLVKDDIQIHYENERLIISVEEKEQKDDETDNYVHRERYIGSFKRSIYLKDVDPKKLKATLNNGILTITAPKLESAISKFMVKID